MIQGTNAEKDINTMLHENLKGLYPQPKQALWETIDDTLFCAWDFFPLFILFFLT